MRYARAALAMLAVAGLTAPAFADGAEAPAPKKAAGRGDLIGLLDVRVEGVSDTAAELFAKQIEESLGIAGMQVASRARLREILAGSPWNAACLAGDCLRALKTHAGVSTVIEAGLVSIGPSYHYVITILDTETGEIEHQVARKCDVCTTDEAFTNAALDVVELIQQREDHSGNPLPTAAGGERPRSAPGAGRGKVRRTAIFLIGAAVVAGAGGAYLMSRDEDRVGAAALGAGGAFAVAGVTCLGVSFSF